MVINHNNNFEKILCPIHNHLQSLLNKILDNDHIPSGHQIQDVLEEFRVMYYKELKVDGDKPESGDSGGEEDGKTLTLQMEDFHPHEFYNFKEWGPTVIGGYGRVIFLKNVEDMQECLGTGVRRTQFRDKKRKDEDTEAHKQKKISLWCTLQHEHPSKSWSLRPVQPQRQLLQKDSIDSQETGSRNHRQSVEDFFF